MLEARRLRYRARSAFKLLELDSRFKLLHRSAAVVECGAAPGAWTQVAVEKVKGGVIVGCDLQRVEPVEGAIVFSGADFTLPETQAMILEALDGRKPNLVMSDMATNAIGVGSHDSEATIRLAVAALRFAVLNSEIGSNFLCKVFRGKSVDKFVDSTKRFYDTVKLVKPKSSRNESSEIYVVASSFRGIQQE